MTITCITGTFSVGSDTVSFPAAGAVFAGVSTYTIDTGNDVNSLAEALLRIRGSRTLPCSSRAGVAAFPATATDQISAPAGAFIRRNWLRLFRTL